MRGRKFSFAAWLSSLVGAALGAVGSVAGTAGVIRIVRRVFSPEWGGNNLLIPWYGAFFAGMFAGGWLGLNLWIKWNRNYEIQRSGGRLGTFLPVLLLLFGTGAGGQALFMYSKEEVAVSAAVDMVLLLDASGSMDMAGFSLPRTEAACQFVDSLDEDCRLSAIAFASIVLDSSELRIMDARGKENTKEFIRGIDSVGATDFNLPLKAAMDILESEGRTDCRKAVLLLTDGEGELAQNLAGEYLEKGILVYTIRLSASSGTSSYARELAEFAADTGGFDTCLKPDSDGSVDTADMLAAFQDAFRASTQTQVVMRGELMNVEGNTAYQFLVRLVTLCLYSLFCGIGYFGRPRKAALFLNLLMGAVWSGLLYLFPGEKGVFYLLLLCVLMTSAVVCIEPDGGEVMDV